MSSRKYSLKMDQNIHQIIDYNSKSIQLTRTRKNSIGFNKPYLEQINANINITLDEKLTQKLMFIKKLEKLEKDAIRNFYDQKLQQCFQILQKTYTLLQQRSLHSITQGSSSSSEDTKYCQHIIYIRYLQCEFKYKLKLFEQSRQYYEKVIKIINKLSKNQKDKTKQYISSLEALNCCLLFQEGRYQQAVKEIEEFQWKVEEGKFKVSQKLVKQVYLCRIQSLMEINEFKLSIKLIQKYVIKFPLSTLRQKWKINSILALCYKKNDESNKAEQIMENLIESMRKQDSIYDTLSKYKNQQKYNQFKSYLSKSYGSYVEMFWEEPIKAIFLVKKWGAECQMSDHAKIKLFHLYYQIGDYEQALTEFSQISQNYKKTADDWQVLAEIKYFYGQLQTSKHLFLKSMQLLKSQERKIVLQIRLLEFTESGTTHKQSIKSIEKKIKENRYKQWIGKIIQKYGQYLRTIGEQYRLEKINQIIAVTNENKNKMNNGVVTNPNEIIMNNNNKYGNISFKKEDNEINGKQKKRDNFAISKII